jgi:predicted AlkP superfamily phosphohydrolase/phosphomutase
LDEGYRVAILDLPFAASLSPRPHSVFMTGWQCHDDFLRQGYPNHIWSRMIKKHGRPRLTPEVFGEQSPETLLELRNEVLETNEQFANICADLLQQERWDLFLAVFGATHRGTHYLWDLSQIDTQGVDERTVATLRGARDDCYVSWDAALKRVLDAVPSDARVLVFALHGMEANDGWLYYLPRMVERIHGAGRASTVPRNGLVYRMKKALPWKLVRQVTRRIPHAWNIALVPMWSRRMHDWPRTKYFTLPVDIHGFIRLNVKGREAEGIVEPDNMDAECAALRAGLMSFRDLDSGEPVIADVVKVDDLVGRDSPQRSVLPDLVVLWARPHGVMQSSGVLSETFGEVRWDRGAKFASGRSGNHTHRGWYVAMGPGIDPGESAQVYDTLDLMPTVFEWIGAPRPDFFQGNPIRELTGTHAVG